MLAALILASIFLARAPLAAAEPVCTDTWTGPSEGGWESSGDWSSGHAPHLEEVACIGSGHRVTVYSEVTTGVVQGAGGLVVPYGGSLKLSDGLEPSTIGRLTITGGGVLRGVAEVVVTNSFEGGSGTIEGSGSLVVESGATGAVGGEVLHLNGASLVNEGTFTVDSGAGLEGEGHAVLANSGTFYVQGEDAGENHGLSGAEGAATLVNTGTVEKSEGSGSDPIDYAIENEGSVVVTAGELHLAGGGASGVHKAGSWSASGAGAKLLFTAPSEASYSLGATVSMTGSIEIASGLVSAGAIEGSSADVTLSNRGVRSGILELTGAGASTIHELAIADTGGLSGGVLRADAEAQIAHSFQGGSGTVEGSGSLVVESGATGAVVHSSGGTMHLDGASLVNEGTFTVDSGAGLEGEGHAVFANDGTLYVQGESTGENEGLSGTEGAATLVNTGTVEKSEGGGSDPIDYAIENEGSVLVTAGELHLAGGGVSGVHKAGSWSASGAGAKLLFTAPSEASYSLGANVPMSGAIEIASGLVSAGVIEGETADLTLSGMGVRYGLLELTGAGASKFHDLSVTANSESSGGVLAGSSDVDVSGSFLGGGQAIDEDTGTLLIEAGADGTITPTSSPSFYLSKGTIENDGTTTVQKGSGVQGEAGALLVNRGKLVVNGEAEGEGHGLIAAELQAFLTNYGVLEKSEGTGITPIQFETTNDGAIVEATGHFKFRPPRGVREAQALFGGPGDPASPNQPCPSCGDPVELATGNLVETQPDISIDGLAGGLHLTRTYNSQAAAGGAKGAFGYGWTTTFSDHLEISSASEEKGETIRGVTLHEADGRAVAFKEGSVSGDSAPTYVTAKLSGSHETGYTVTYASQTKLRFSSSGRLESVSDREGDTTTLAYTEAGRLKSATDPAGRKLTFAYNGEGLVESVSDPMGRTIKYAYESGDLISVTLPGGSEPRWRFKYDAAHQLTEMKDGRGGKTTNEYNASHQVVSQTDPRNITRTFEYAPFRTETTNEASHAKTIYWFTSNEEPAVVTRAAGTAEQTTTMTYYDEDGYPISETDGDGHTTKLEWDSEGNRTSERNADGDETKWEYDGKHDVVGITAPSGETTTIERDEHGNAVKVSRPAPGASTQEYKYEYDAYGDLKSMTTPEGRQWKYEYDSDGERIAATAPSGAKTTWAYNEDSEAISETTARGNASSEPAKYRTGYERNALGQVTTITRPAATGLGKPVDRTPPAVAGVTQEGETLSATPGVWAGAPTLSYGYQWQYCNAEGGECSNVTGATSSTLHTNWESLGHAVRVVVTASNGQGSRSSASASTRLVTTAAPPVFASSFGSGGTGSGQFERPLGVAVDPHGDVWVADIYNDRIEKFSSTGTWLASYGHFGSGSGEFEEPFGIAIDQSTGNVYVADRGNGRVDELNEAGEWVRSWTGGAHALDEPGAIAVNSIGDVWVTSSGNDRVEEFKEEGAYVREFGSEGSGGGEFDGPTGVDVAAGLVIVGDLHNARIEAFSEEGEYLGEVAGWGWEIDEFLYPGGIGADGSGDSYVADIGNDRVQEFNSEGVFLAAFGAEGSGPGQFDEPEDVAVAPSGATYVSDSGNNRIERWLPVTKPASVLSPSISGELLVGQTLKAGAGIWTSGSSVSYSYQWERCNDDATGCANISGATSATYTTTETDLGKTLRLKIAAKNSEGETTATSSATSVIEQARKTKYTYDADGAVASVTDPQGGTTSYTYDADEQPTKTEQPDGAVAETAYDSEGQIESQTDGDKHITRYVRNELGEVTEAIDPEEHTTSSEYDDAGNLTKTTDARGRTTKYKYDPANRLTEVSFSEGGTHSLSFEYDSNGDRTKMIDGSGTTKSTYDQLDRLTGTEDGNKEKVDYEYDLNNEPTKITYPNGKAVTRSYDEDGRLETVRDWNEHTTSFEYDADGDLTSIEYPSGTGDKDTYVYDESDEPTEATFDKSSEVLARIGYARDNGGLIDAEAGEGLPGEPSIGYAYDSAQRLTAAGASSYGYDAANNLTETNAGTYTYSAGDELESGPGTSYAYNEVGERTKATPGVGAATSYSYDQIGNLTAVKRSKYAAIPEIDDSYESNADGLRTGETVNGTTSHLDWDEAEEPAPLLSNGTYSFVYGPGNLPIEQINNSTGTVTYLHHDQAGSTRLLTGSTGAVAGKCSYGAYGAPICEGTTTTLLGYDSQYTSSDTGLIYLRNRIYDPTTAQFLTRDPLAAISGEPYSYAGDNPLNDSDPTGLLFGISLPSWEEAGEAIAGWGDTITFGLTKRIREGIGDENVDACSGAYQGGGVAGLVTGALIPGEDDAELAEGTTTLYRAVGDEEAADIAATGTYRVPPGGVEGKYFTSSQEQAQAFIDSGWAATLTSAEFPNSIVDASAPVSLGGEGSGYLVPAKFFPYGPVSIGGG